MGVVRRAEQPEKRYIFRFRLSLVRIKRWI